MKISLWKEQFKALNIQWVIRQKLAEFVFKATKSCKQAQNGAKFARDFSSSVTYENWLWIYFHDFSAGSQIYENDNNKKFPGYSENVAVFF